MAIIRLNKQWKQKKPILGSTIDWSHPLSRGLVGCWLMNEGGGGIVRDSVSTLNGIITQPVSFTPQGLYCGGTTGYVNCGANKRLSYTLFPFTVVYRYFCLSAGNTTSRPIVRSSDSVNYNGFDLSLSVANRHALTLGNNGGTGSGSRQSFISGDFISVNSWRTIACGATDINTAFFYNNGINVGFSDSGGTAVTMVSSGANPTIGKSFAVYLNNVYLTYIYVYNRALSPSEIQQLYQKPYCFIGQSLNRLYFIQTGASAVLSGTVTTATETDIVNGGKTIILTLTNDTWIAAGALSFDLQRQNIINGLDSAQSELFGWDNVVKALQGVAGVVRTSDTVVTITLDAQITYDITATETITATIPATALTGNAQIVATPTFQITPTDGAIVTRKSYYKGRW